MKGVRRLEKMAAGLSFLAGAIHLAAGPDHLRLWWAYGLFFFSAAAAQVGFGLVLATRGIEGWGGWDAVRGRVCLVGVAGTLAIMALWAVSRTVGVPLGPEQEPEGIGPLDAASKLVEAALVGVLLWLWALDRRPAQAAPAPA